MHDAALDMAFSYLNEKYEINGDNSEIGDYTLIHKYFSFIDLEYLSGLFGDDSIFNIAKKMDKRKKEAEIATTADSMLNRQQKRNFANDIRKKVAEINENIEHEYRDIEEIIRAIAKTIPYKRFLYSSDGYLIPLDDRYIRDKADAIGFKHAGTLTCLGMITNTFGENSTSESNDVFGVLQHGVNEILRMLMSAKENDFFVVHPIAVYYGE